MLKKQIIFTIGLLALFLLSCVNHNQKLETHQTNPRCKGPANARVSIEEFSDFECFFCMQSQSSIKRLLQDYKGDIQLCFRYFPLKMHKHARKAAIAACIASDYGRFWQYHDMLFVSMFEWSSLDEKQCAKKFVELAQQIGINPVEFEQKLINPPQHCITEIENDIKRGKELKLDGTPTFFINKTKIVGALPYKVFKETVEKAKNAKSDKGKENTDVN